MLKPCFRIGAKSDHRGFLNPYYQVYVTKTLHVQAGLTWLTWQAVVAWAYRLWA